MITWDDKKLSVGIELIDNQHKMLIHLINQLSKVGDDETNVQLKNNDAFENVFSQLVQYTQYHFESEEAYFLELDHADVDKHIQQHRSFINQLNQFKKSYCTSEENTRSQLIKLITFLTEWLVFHIQHEDKKFIKKSH